MVVGDWLPRSFFGYFHAVFSNIRCVYIMIYLIFFQERPHLVFMDQVSLPILFLRLFSSIKVIFYCHFPDFLLVTRFSTLRNMYRLPLNFLEQISTGMAHKVLVNSFYTSQVFPKAFPFLYRRGICPRVLYPIARDVDEKSFLEPRVFRIKERMGDVEPTNNARSRKTTIFLSINRFERKKALELAIFSFADLKEQITKCDSKLIICGGFDLRLAENKEYYEELKREAKRLGIFKYVYFLKSISASLKSVLLEISSCILYTPINEHFGIVPLEAMSTGKPVIACNSGGPLETIVHGTTGILCAANYKFFSEAMNRIVTNPKFCAYLGKNARTHVLTCFSPERFQLKLKHFIDEVHEDIGDDRDE